MAKIDKKYIPSNNVHIFTFSKSEVMPALVSVLLDYSKGLRAITGEKVVFRLESSQAGENTRIWADNITESQADFYTGLCNGWVIARGLL